MSGINIEKQIAYRRKVGSLDGDPVYEVALMGGLYLLTKSDMGSKLDILGAGPHPAVARYIAEKQHPKLQWTDLRKSEALDVAYFADLLPSYVELTQRFKGITKQG